MIYMLPVLIGLIQGFCLLTVLLPRDQRPRAPLMVCWGSLTGMITTAFLTWTSLIAFNAIVPAYVIFINVAVTIILVLAARQRGLTLPFGPTQWDRGDLIGLHILLAAMIPAVLHARFYPHGGWDAWSCWNLKSVFLFQAGDDWKRMFDPVLWRSNTAYPFLLPLMNVWAWCFSGTPDQTVPLVTTCRIPLLTAMILFFSLKDLTGNKWSLLAPLWMLSIMFFVKLASSQYSDLLVGTWLLSALIAFVFFLTRRAPAYLALFIISLGAMSFTKSEGLVLSLITGFWAGLLILTTMPLRRAALSTWKILAGILLVSFLPTMVFQLGWAPKDSHTFINGLTSTSAPAHIDRLLATLMFLKIEVFSWKWNGFWFLVAGGVLLAWGRAWRQGLWMIPVIVLSYLASLIAVYYVNTFFPIIWWLSTTLNRLIYALIPALIFWTFLAHFRKDESP